MPRRMDDRVNEFYATGAKVTLLLESPSVHGGPPDAAELRRLAYERMNAL